MATLLLRRGIATFQGLFLQREREAIFYELWKLRQLIIAKSSTITQMSVYRGCWLLSLLLCVFAVLLTTRGVCTWTLQRVARIHDWCQTLTLTFHERKTSNQDNQTNQCYANNAKIHNKKDANFPAHARQIRVLFSANF